MIGIISGILDETKGQSDNESFSQGKEWIPKEYFVYFEGFIPLN